MVKLRSASRQKQQALLKLSEVMARAPERSSAQARGAALVQMAKKLTQSDTPAVLMGQSGSGKSALGKLLLGFCLAEKGSVQVDGRDVRHPNELPALFGVVPQQT